MTITYSLLYFINNHFIHLYSRVFSSIITFNNIIHNIHTLYVLLYSVN